MPTPGPSATIYFPTPVAAADLVALIEDRFQTMTPERIGAPDDPRRVFEGLVDQRPIEVELGLEYAEQFEDIDVAGFTAAFGFAPAEIAEIFAAARRCTEVDHLLLAHLCIQAADRFGGVIGFDVKPWTLTESMAGGLKGKWAALREFDGGEALSEKPVNWFCDSEFLRNWKACGSFRMA